MFYLRNKDTNSNGVSGLLEYTSLNGRALCQNLRERAFSGGRDLENDLTRLRILKKDLDIAILTFERILSKRKRSTARGNYRTCACVLPIHEVPARFPREKT
jgi:hypothetical protein